MLLLPGVSAVLLAQLPQQTAEYGGPSVLSRGEAPSRYGRSGDIAFRPYLGVTGIYDSGLFGVTVAPDGKLPNTDAVGVEVMAGLYGYHNWRRTTVGLDYRGNFRHYNRNTYYDGSDQFLTLGIGHQLSKRVAFNFREAAGTYSRNYFLLSGSGFFDPLSMDIPAAEIFDNRVYFLDTAADLTYRKSARLSFNAGGDGFLIRRRSSSLFGVSGAAARGDVAYRLGRHSTVGVAYRFNHFGFVRAFGASDIHTADLLYAVRLSRDWELSLQAGGSRIESLFLSRVQIDPAVAAITGQTVGLEASYKVRYAPDLMGRLSRTFRHASLQFAYKRTTSAGNGIFVTATQESATASYSYSGVRRWSLGVNTGYERMKALAQTMGQYHGYVVGAGITRQIGKGFSFLVRADERWYETGYKNFNRHALRASVGFVWSPQDIPLALW